MSALLVGVGEAAAHARDNDTAASRGFLLGLDVVDDESSSFSRSLFHDHVILAPMTPSGKSDDVVWINRPPAGFADEIARTRDGRIFLSNQLDGHLLVKIVEPSSPHDMPIPPSAMERTSSYGSREDVLQLGSRPRLISLVQRRQ